MNKKANLAEWIHEIENLPAPFGERLKAAMFEKLESGHEFGFHPATELECSIIFPVDITASLFLASMCLKKKFSDNMVVHVEGRDPLVIRKDIAYAKMSMTPKEIKEFEKGMKRYQGETISVRRWLWLNIGW